VIRAVLDTNVLVSGLLRHRSGSPPVAIIEAWREGHFELVTSREIIAEVGRALGKPYFRARLSQDQVDRALGLLRRRTFLVRVGDEVTEVVGDPADNLVVATAVGADADYLVTGDSELLAVGAYAGVRIVSPRTFLTVLPSR
jgi:putative PIN family toxin of toxin-antitoxin system